MICSIVTDLLPQLTPLSQTADIPDLNTSREIILMEVMTSSDKVVDYETELEMVSLTFV